VTAALEERLSRLEDQNRRLHERLERVEAWVQVPADRPAPPARPVETTPPEPTKPSVPLPRPEPAPERDLEELLGGRLLALVGGVAVLVGLTFLVALAVQRGWLGEGARTLLAFVGSAVLLALGAWLHENRGRTQASLAACGTGLAGLFLSLTAASVLYDLVPVALALAASFVFGAIGAALAVRWNAPPIGGLGILGALAAPILTGAAANAQALLFLAIAEAAAVAVLVWRRWDWLRVAAVALVLVQIAYWALSADPATTRGFVVLALFGALNLAAGMGFELRAGTDTRIATTVIVVGNAVVLGLLGVDVAGTRSVAGWWLAGLGIAYALAGFTLLWLQPRNRTIAAWLFGVGLVSANIAFVVLVSGTAIPIGWAAAAAALAVPTRALTGKPRLVYAVVGAQIALAVIHVLVYDAPLDGLAANGWSSIWPVLTIAASAFLIARLTPAKEIEWRGAADATALAALAYGTADLLHGVALAGAWALEAAVLVEVGRRLGHRVAAAGALGFLLLAGLHVLTFEAPPSALVDGADPFWQAALAGGAVAAVAALACLRSAGIFEAERAVTGTAAATALVYLASVGIVTLFQGDAAVREQGQAILSAFWSLLGLGLLWAGLRRDKRPLRLAGFSLLGVAVGKVFFYDLAALNQEYRVLSFVVLGVLLLAGAYAYQRLRRGGSNVLRTP
jgi:uncharacterized membrane protein